MGRSAWVVDSIKVDWTVSAVVGPRLGADTFGQAVVETFKPATVAVADCTVGEEQGGSTPESCRTIGGSVASGPGLPMLSFRPSTSFASIFVDTRGNGKASVVENRLPPEGVGSMTGGVEMAWGESLYGGGRATNG